ncbi:MAG: hypothetical protein HY711_03495, partial [Candidatus Melainabacteria bacterium]|nr:hypothetical protein [Candidatus Melainabacteria bacterium]
PDPTHVSWQFSEICSLAKLCKFSNCLHLVEQGCNVLAHLEQISSSRYHSYSTIVREAQAEEKRRRETSQKIESSLKYVGGNKGKSKAVPRLAERYREASRKVEKQKLGQMTTESAEELSGGEDIGK